MANVDFFGLNRSVIKARTDAANDFVRRKHEFPLPSCDCSSQISVRRLNR